MSANDALSRPCNSTFRSDCLELYGTDVGGTHDVLLDNLPLLWFRSRTRMASLLTGDRLLSCHESHWHPGLLSLGSGKFYLYRPSIFSRRSLDMFQYGLGLLPALFGKGHYAANIATNLFLALVLVQVHMGCSFRLLVHSLYTLSLKARIGKQPYDAILQQSSVLLRGYWPRSSDHSFAHSGIPQRPQDTLS
ncbi:hypothetical protein FA15DRAFT_41944 [Coprinopsis marcescibilis]|uniref:Uncharacterized protein n=1 Tax=Coprinopsis marcescibilis TaxID=230819 RepID=A0A5C3LIV2_COPMA|nr:hypothetical protein FA15DRAFT_41944 [Coprinopsis marcescibilis]